MQVGDKILKEIVYRKKRILDTQTIFDVIQCGKSVEIWSQGKTTEFMKINRDQEQNIDREGILIVSEIFSDYRIVRMVKPEGVFLSNTQLKPENGIYIPQTKIKGKWYYMAIGKNEKGEPNHVAFTSPELAEEYIKDYHSKQVAIKEANKKNE